MRPKIGNFIDAIKTVRKLGHVVRPNFYTQVPEVVASVSLLEAKRLVEDIMELGVRRFLENSLAEVNRKNELARMAERIAQNTW
jgi:hypothetical protein